MECFLVVDRIESGWAAVQHIENGSSFDLPMFLLPEWVREGDVLAVQITIDEEQTRKRKEYMHRLIDENMEDAD